MIIKHPAPAPMNDFPVCVSIKLMKKVNRSLPDIRIPALVIKAKNDPKVAPHSGPEIFRRLGTNKKRVAWIDHDLHGIVRGNISGMVFKEVELFLAEQNLIHIRPEMSNRLPGA